MRTGLVGVVTGLVLLTGCTKVTPGQVYADPGMTPASPTTYVSPPSSSPEPVADPFARSAGGDRQTQTGDDVVSTTSPGSPSDQVPSPVTTQVGPVTISTVPRPVQVEAAPDELILPGYEWVSYVAEEPLPSVATGQALLFVSAPAEDVTRWVTTSLVPPTWSSTKVERFTSGQGVVHKITTVVRESAAGPVRLTYETYPDGAGGTLVRAGWDYFWQPASAR